MLSRSAKLKDKACVPLALLIVQAQRFLDVHLAVNNLFNPGRHLISAIPYRLFRMRGFASWKGIVA